MFPTMRRSDRALTEEENKTILANGEYGVLSTVGANGYPYGTPVHYVYRNGKIYFHCADGAGHKLDNLNFCTNVCFTVIGESQVLPEKFATKYQSVIVFGSANKIVDGKRIILEEFIAKYAPQFKETGLKYIRRTIDETGIYEITVEHITGKARKD